MSSTSKDLRGCFGGGIRPRIGKDEIFCIVVVFVGSVVGSVVNLRLRQNPRALGRFVSQGRNGKTHVVVVVVVADADAEVDAAERDSVKAAVENDAW